LKQDQYQNNSEIEAQISLIEDDSAGGEESEASDDMNTLEVGEMKAKFN